jgi:hypothetical protein
VPALALLSSDPADGAIDVTVKQVISLTFNQAIKADSASSATVMVFRVDADVPLVGNISASGATVSFIPASVLNQDALYRIKIIGSNAALGYALQASDGTFFSTTTELSFRTGIERFVRLTEVADRDDIERIGPIREGDPLAAQPTGVVAGIFSIESQDPEPFEKAGIAFTAVTVDFDRTVDASTVTTSTFRVTQVPVLGIEDYWASIPAGQTVPQLATQQGGALTPPACTLVVDDDEVRCEIDPSGVVLHNTEFQVTVTTSVKGTDGTSLPQNVSYVFTTEYVPLYISPQYLRLELGNGIASVSDDTLCRLIHKISLEAWELSGRGIPLVNPPYRIRKWVECKTILDLLGVLMISRDLRAGETKTLGDLTIRFSPRDPMLGAKYQQATKCLAEIGLFDHVGQLASVAVKGRASGSERQDFRARTWDHLFLHRAPAANLTHERDSKMLLSQQYALADKLLLHNTQFFVTVGANIFSHHHF